MSEENSSPEAAIRCFQPRASAVAIIPIPGAASVVSLPAVSHNLLFAPSASSGSVTNVLRQFVRCMKPRDPAFHEDVLAGRENIRSVERSRIHTDLLGRFCAGEHQVAAAGSAKTPCSIGGRGVLGRASSDPGEARRWKGSPCDYRRAGIPLTHPAMTITGVQGRRGHPKPDFSAQTTPVMDGHRDLRLDDGFFAPTGILPHHPTVQSGLQGLKMQPWTAPLE